MLLVMVGMVSTVTLLKVAVIPCVVNPTLSTVPHLWISCGSCLFPLYIYIFLNFIIITMAASSFQHPNQKNLFSSSSSSSSKVKKQLIQSEQSKVQNDQINWNSFHISQEEEEEDQEKHSVSVSTEEPISITPSDPIDISTFADDPLPETDTAENPMIDSGEITTEKPEEEDEFDDTLEATWNAVTEKESKPKGRQLKKSDTWDVPPRVVGIKPEVENPAARARGELKKSETFTDRVTMIRDKSMSQEELYERAEAFIKKLKQDMRLQRQEANQRFMEMVNRDL
ncbi:hypothetical protein FEM48_Zijuj05G0182700 [Ziziphus jujuba var. spinosa]|uniref:DUF4408 domain-containing protein n=1 Tax=Ziziphus jujuba var. spinosa TaxID=714518 RepID=A0A978VGD6_ZIZJJ|nr:uncharacterized protein LOC112491557 [Ziziphus jujuba var. spinosa]KAH7529425.1 hypothetical protein FEM48_Zijuj05G0182700 [Ziziphus jujuba var. spinosa]